VRGKVEVYNPGIAAGNVVIVKKGEFVPASLTPYDIVILEEIPDDIPPVAAIITSVPQTPLAHIALLARARRTPNVYWGAASTSDPFVIWNYYQKRVIVKASPDGVTFRVLTAAEWEEYMSKGKVTAIAVPQVDLTQAPYTYDLEIGGMAQMLGTVPLVGGKSGGFMALLERPETLPVPDRPLGVTIRAFAEHMKRTAPPIDTALMAQLSSQTDARARYLILEGEDRFRSVYAALPIHLEWLDAYKAGTLANGQKVLPQFPLLQQALAAGGIRKLVRSTPILPATLSTIRATLTERFAFLAPAQALRFRSSSSAEDIEGFNGAGLYESNSGWLFPEAAPVEEAKKTIERALLKTWDSYWLFGAFEERRNAGIEHLSGNMGVAVHPRFDDDKELANGVITLELARLPTGPRTVLSVNVQKGAMSVTNPPVGSNALPEVDVVRSSAPGQVERVRPSTEVAAGEYLLSDAELTSMHADLAELASDWLDARNARHAPQQANSTLTIDLEFKRMRGDWPIRVDGDRRGPARLQAGAHPGGAHEDAGGPGVGPSRADRPPGVDAARGPADLQRTGAAVRYVRVLYGPADRVGRVPVRRDPLPLVRPLPIRQGRSRTGHPGRKSGLAPSHGSCLADAPRDGRWRAVRARIRAEKSRGSRVRSFPHRGVWKLDGR